MAKSPAMLRIGLLIGCAALSCATSAQAARTLTLTFETRGSGQRVTGYGMQGPIFANLESANFTVVMSSYPDSVNAFSAISGLVLTNFAFGNAGLSFASSPPASSYYFRFEPSSICFDGSAGIPLGQVKLGDGCSTVSYNLSSPGGRGEIYTGAVTGLRIAEGDPLGQGVGISFVSYIPEPGSWALMIAGFGMAGAAIRRRGRRMMPRAA